MKKGLLITAAVFVAIGVALLAVAYFLSGRDLTKLSGIKYETNTYTVESDFNDISIITAETDVVFKPSEDGKFSAVCVEKEKVRHTFSVEDGVLKISVDDQREWFDHFLFHKSLVMTVYLPLSNYGSLKIEQTTGDVEIPETFSFTNVDITASTGDVIYSAAATETVKIKTSTADIKVNGINAGNVDLSVSTGDIIAENICCEKTLSVKVSTGDATLSDITCLDLVSTGSTGDITMKNVVASGSINIERSTGDVVFDSCDAASITVRASTGDVSGTLKSEKVFITKTSTGRINVPKTTTGGLCEITTSTGDIDIKIA